MVLVDMLRGDLVRAWNGNRIEVIAHLGGGPNGAALGPDGSIYVCNNGGLAWHKDEAGFIVIPGFAPSDYAGGWIERVDLSTGRSERLYTQVNGHPLIGPNDLVFDEEGAFWFTDTGKIQGRTRHLSGLYHARADGSKVSEVDYGAISYNGVGLSKDGMVVYVAETLTSRLWAYDLAKPGTLKAGSKRRLVATLQGESYLDSLAVTESGNVCVGVVGNGGVATISVSGHVDVMPLPDHKVTNICFGGKDLRDAYITLTGTGKLIKMRWPEPGLALNFNGYP